jgi:hypothetical protein
VLDSLAPTATGVTAHLHLLEHARGELLLDDAHTTTGTRAAGFHFAVGAACALALFADVLLVPRELGGGAIVEVAKTDFNTDFDVVAPGFARASTKVAMASEEAAEEIEGVVAAAAATSAVAVLL